MSEHLIAIDPDVSGALALLSGASELLEVADAEAALLDSHFCASVTLSACIFIWPLAG